jgi:hypothetical protein
MMCGGCFHLAAALQHRSTEGAGEGEFRPTSYAKIAEQNSLMETKASHIPAFMGFIFEIQKYRRHIATSFVINRILCRSRNVKVS